MNAIRVLRQPGFAGVALALALARSLPITPPQADQPAAGVAPEVLKVEPPNWWVGQMSSPVRVLIRGRNLAGARVEARSPGIHAANVRPNKAGTYLFIDVRIDAQARPGRRELKIITSGGEAKAAFDVLAATPRQGRFGGFSPDDIVYLLMPDRFSDGEPSNDDPAVSRGLFDRAQPRYYHGGDFQGIINHLPYLKDLGVTAIWMTPIYDNTNRLGQIETHEGAASTDYHGYGAVDFYGVEEHFGDMGKLRELVDDAHRLGLKVIQDQVANHTSPYHPWVTDPPTPTWFHGTAADHLAETWQTWTLLDPHSAPEMRRSTLDGWFSNILPDLNQDDPEVERYLIQNTLWWLGMAGFDGIREDTLPYVPRRFWHDWMAAIKRQYPKVTVVGEVFDGDPALTSFFQGGATRSDGIDSGVDTVFDFPLYYKIRQAFAQGKTIRDLAAMLAHDYLYPRPDLLVTFIGNHDVARFMNEPGASAQGLELADTFLLTARGIPVIYYGDEIALRGGEDPDNRRDFPGGWPEDSRNAFRPAGRTAEEEVVFEHVRQLAKLRGELEPLRRGAMLNLARGEQTYAYARVSQHGSAVVIFNNGTEPETVEFRAGPARMIEGAALEDRLRSGPPLRVEHGKVTVTLPPRTASVYVVSNRPRKSGGY